MTHFLEYWYYYLVGAVFFVYFLKGKINKKNEKEYYDVETKKYPNIKKATDAVRWDINSDEERDRSILNVNLSNKKINGEKIKGDDFTEYVGEE